MRSLRAHTQSHAQCAGHRATGHHGRDHPQRICRRERDSAFGDERCAQQPGCCAVLLLGRGVEVPAHRGRQGHRQRRNHAGSHHGRHDHPGRLSALGKPRGGEQVGRLVDRAAEVEAHHQAEDDAEQHRGRASHAGQPVLQTGHGRRQRTAQQQQHQQTDEHGREQRNNDHGHQSGQPARRFQ